MNHRRAQATLLIAFGAAVFRLGRSLTATSYVKPFILPLLVLSGVVLVGIGVVTIVRHRRNADEHGPRAGWLLLLPLVALIVVGPGPLGAFAALRLASHPPVHHASAFPPLPAADHDGSIPLSLSEFSARALYESSRTLAGQPIRLSGFVVPNGGDRQTYLLTRLVINCCAADARPVQVLVRGDAAVREPDTWVEVTGTWTVQPTLRPGEVAPRPPELVATEVTDLPEPAEPYEQRLAGSAG